METIATLIRLALVECYDKGIIDWLPGDGEPETFIAECEISQNFHPAQRGFPSINDFYVILCGVFCVVDIIDNGAPLVVWHSSRVHDEVICREKPCEYCVA